MEPFFLDPQAWAEAQFGECRFGDIRLTRRIVRNAAEASRRPDSSTPHQTGLWKDCKAAYRLMGNERVTFEAIVEPHCRETRASLKPGRYLSLCDTTEVIFAKHRIVRGLGPVGSGREQGFLLHSSLIVTPTGEVIGLGAQELFYRKPRPAGDNSVRRKKRKRESEVWGRVADQVGAPPPGVRITHVCDRAADDFEFFCHCVRQRAGWIVRAKQLTRTIQPMNGISPKNPRETRSMNLERYLATLPGSGTYELSVRESKEGPARTALIEVRIGAIWMPRPSAVSPWVRDHGPKSIRMSVVEVREVNAPKNVTPLHWVLLTDDKVETFNDAWRVVADYEQRPIIEEYHKAMKTGCKVEERLYKTASRLERVAGVLSIVAVRLLQMRTVARATPDRPAKEVAPPTWVQTMSDEMLARLPQQTERWRANTMTTRDFYRGIAMLGGFLARKSDGDPGWITLWRGVRELVTMVATRQRLIKRYG